MNTSGKPEAFRNEGGKAALLQRPKPLCSDTKAPSSLYYLYNQVQLDSLSVFWLNAFRLPLAKLNETRRARRQVIPRIID